MSRIDELIQALCPVGVPRESLGQVCIIKTGQPVSKVMISKNPGEYPVINSGREPLGFIDQFNTEDDPIGITSRGAGVGSVTWCPGKYYRGNLNYSVTIKDTELMNVRFLYYLLMQNQSGIQQLATYQGIPALNKSNLEKLRIPIPPLEVQKEIVNILDKFTELEAELSAELSAELEARRKQYEYYRNKLLIFDNSVQWVNLGDAGKFYGGLTGKTKTDFGTGSGSFITYMNIFSNIAVDTGKVEPVKIGETERQNKVEVGDILFTGSSESAEEVGMTSVLTKQTAFPLYLNSFCFGYRFNTEINVDPEFTKHLFRSKAVRKHIIATASGVTRFNISKKRMAKISVPIPPMSDQIRIAAILDKFDTLTTGISSGLPAEIHARRQQYEYYRTKLLTFQELSA